MMEVPNIATITSTTVVPTLDATNARRRFGEVVLIAFPQRRQKLSECWRGSPQERQAPVCAESEEEFVTASS
jgi:hypothetical protein